MILNLYDRDGQRRYLTADERVTLSKAAEDACEGPTFCSLNKRKRTVFRLVPLRAAGRRQDYAFGVNANINRILRHKGASHG